MRGFPGYTDPHISPVTGILSGSGQIPLPENNVLVGNSDGVAAPVATILMSNLPNLSTGKSWIGDISNRPVETTFSPSPDDATYVIRTPDTRLPNAQNLLSVLGTNPEVMLKVVTAGILGPVTLQHYYFWMGDENNFPMQITLGDGQIFRGDGDTVVVSDDLSSAESSITSLQISVASLNLDVISLDASVAVINAALTVLQAQVASVLALATEAEYDATTALNRLDALTLNTINTDGDISVAFFRIINLGDPVDPNDAVNFTTMSSSIATAINSVVGTTNEIDVTHGIVPLISATISIADNAVLPGTGGITLPEGTTAERAGAAGTIRFNTDTSLFEGTADGSTWQAFDRGTAGIISITAGIGLVATPANPIIETGTLSVNTELAGLSALSANGYIKRTGAGTYTSVNPIPLADGGTNANLTASNGGIFYSTASAAAILGGTSTARQVLLSGASGAPSWSTATYPATTTLNRILYSSSNNVIDEIASAANGVLITSSGGIPSISSTLPSAVQGNITTVGTIGTGTWQGTIIGLAYGGTNANLTASNGGILYSTASALAILSGTSTARQVLLSGASTTPAWSSATYPSTTTANRLLYSSATNTITDLATSNNSVLVTDGSGVPSLSATLPSAVQGNITTTGTITSGTWNGTIIDVARGGSNRASATAYSIICGGTTSTGAHQSVASVGTSGQVLTSQGASALPIWTTLSTIGVTSITGTANQVLANSTTGSAQTGAITLTLPQSIATSSSPTFAGLSLNPSSSSSALFTGGTSSSNLYIQAQGTVTGSGAFVLTGNDSCSIYVTTQISPTISNGWNIWNYFYPQGTLTGTTTQNSAAIYVQGGGYTLNSGASIVNAYSAVFETPNFGTHRCAVYAYNLSVGYAGISPPTNGAIISGNVGIGASSASFALDVNGTARRTGNITTTETISSATALSLTKDSILDTRNGSFTATLADSDTDRMKQVWLYARTGNTATISCTLNGTQLGKFDLTQAEPMRTLFYGPSGWECRSQSPNIPESFYCTTQIDSLQPYVGTGATGSAFQGSGVAISSNGRTIAVGGYTDNSSVGAVWIFTNIAGPLVNVVATYQQQGSKLVGTGNTGASAQGWSVALSADGNTLAVGGYNDNSNAGAIWVYTRSGSTWTQQGSKLVGTGATGSAQQGMSISLSADGNTLAVGGYNDNSAAGAAWIFTRSSGTWTQQGSKLVGTGASGNARQGWSVALSADGNTLAVGGKVDNGSIGATWIFIRTGTSWAQQGSKLTASDNSGSSQQGYSVSLSADGNTLAVGGPADNSSVGATWIYTRSGTTWSQYQTKLVGSSNTGISSQGYSVAISADGFSLAVGGPDDNSSFGAIWTFYLINRAWVQKNKLVPTGNTGSTPNLGYSIAYNSNANTLAIGGPGNNSTAGGLWVFG